MTAPHDSGAKNCTACASSSGKLLIWVWKMLLRSPCCSAVWGAALFVVTLSLGESFWSPRWYDYSMSLAPYGREGIFTALASAPLFAAKLPTGASWCPHTMSCRAYITNQLM